MGKGIDLAAMVAPVHAAAMDNMKEQLLLCLVQRLGGKVSIHVSEIDDTGGLLLMMSVDPETKVFNFVVEKKQ